MRNGGIGLGWRPEEPEDEVAMLASGLLRSKLDQIWYKLQKSYEIGQTKGVRGGRFGMYR
jgi:hypothetical protein